MKCFVGSHCAVVHKRGLRFTARAAQGKVLPDLLATYVPKVSISEDFVSGGGSLSSHKVVRSVLKCPDIVYIS